MLFTTGNLITLGIVLVVLLVYRQLDRDNRTLEKVKKFADRQRDELSAYVDKRSEDLRRFGIELDVQQKAAKVALDRIQAVQEGLSQRAEAIGGIEKRLAEYDTALSRLKDMTSRVDENLLRIHEESDFVNSVVKRVDAAQKDMQGIQRELPALKAGFAADSAAALQVFKAEILADVGKRAGELEQRVERAGSEAEAAAARVESGRAAQERELARGLEKARIEAEKLEDVAFAKLKEGTDAKAARLKEIIEEKFSQLGALAKEKATETQGIVKGFKAEWKSEAEDLLAKGRAEAEAAAASLRGQLAESAAQLRESLASTAAAIGAGIEQADARAAGSAAALKESLATAAAALRQDLASTAAAIGAGIEDAEARAAASAASVAMTEKSVAALAAHNAEELAAIAARTQADREAIVAKIKNDHDIVEARLAAEGAALQAKVFEEFGRRIAEYASEAESRFLRLEAAGAEIGAMDQALRASMDQAERRVENDFGAYGLEIEERRKRLEEGIERDAAALRAGMKSLEEELGALKNRAYDNVSEKLKVFEDDFFVDLKARGESVEERLEAWRADLDKTLADLSAGAAAGRVAAEKANAEEMRVRISDNQARIQEQLDKSRERAQAVQDGLVAQGGMAAESLAALKEAVLKDAADARATAQAYVEGEISRFSLETGGKLKAAEREIVGRVDSLAASVSEEEQRVAAAREAVAEAAGSFRARFAEFVADTEAKVRERLDAFAAATGGLLDGSRAEYEAQRDNYAASSQAERDRISRELTGLADRTAELRADLSSRIAQALEGFARSHESLSAELEKKRRDAQAEGELRLREYKDAVQDLGAKLDAQRAQSFGKVEAEAARIGQSVAEIERQQKAFLAQTKLFERADELRESLGGSIEAMKADLSRLEGRRAEVAEIESQLGRVKRLEDEVNQKVSRFLAEKKRIDALEADFSKLAAVSESVDRRLEEVTGQADALTEAQATIRKLIELSKEAEAKYERLDKKAGILDATAEAVDKNFQSAQAVEKAVAALGTEIRRIPERVAELKRGVDELAAGRDKVDEAVGKLAGLDSVIADAERRVAEVQKAREWLARAETRLEEIDRRAQEQLKLLSSILKEEEGPSRPRERGAPPSSAQDAVRKLARQGWSVDEIARAVKISRGEIELILEMGAKG
jgi:chromosome segregation ATPase